MFFLINYLFCRQTFESNFERHWYWQLRNWTPSSSRKAQTFNHLCTICTLLFIGQLFNCSLILSPLILYCLFLHWEFNYFTWMAFCVRCIYIEFTISLSLSIKQMQQFFYQLYSLVLFLFNELFDRNWINLIVYYYYFRFYQI